MSHPDTIAGRRLWGYLLPLTLLAALCLTPPLSAAAPPPRRVLVPEVEGPPLFETEYYTNPVDMTVQFVGARFAPITGQFSSAAVLFAGRHRKVNAWKLGGPLANDDSRTYLGASTLVGQSFRTMPGVGPALTSAVTLAWGEWLHCWPLADTDIFHPLPRVWLNLIRDGKMGSVGTGEAGVYAAVLVRAYYTSDKAFKSVARTDLIHVNLLGEPEEYRGEVVRVRGSLYRVLRLKPPYEADQRGVRDVYVAWIVPDYYGAQMYCVQFVEWPAGLDRKFIGQGKIANPPQVTIDGYFFKKLAYQAAKSELTAPLIIGHALRYDAPMAEIQSGPTAWVAAIVIGILAMTFGVLAGVIGLTYWYRRSDNILRRRLLAARSPEFILPPPDAKPVVPLAAPVRPEPAHTHQRRFEIPPSPGGPPGKGSDRGPADPDPEQDAGSAFRP